MSTVLAAVFAPLAAAALIVLVRRAAPLLALLGALASALATWGTLRAVSAGATFATSLEWLPGVRLRIDVDPLASLLSATVASVGLLVLVYAVGYMAGEREKVRFYAVMSLFLAAMQSLVMAGDWLLFLGSWELIALASYLLIGHWHGRTQVGSAAGRAFLTTRGADVGLYLGVFLLVHESGSTAMGETVGSGGAVPAVAGLLLLVAAAGKAAQVPFQGWLAAAMVGPTPVSALLHSATLVAAGVILTLRASPLLPPGVLLVVGTLGGVTAVVAGLTALAQRDLKRLLAASTSSQLGLMLVGLGAGSPAAAAFHLVAHAAMKSALFLAAGVFQHDRRSTEFRRLRGVGREQRLAFTAFAVAGLALAGLPPLAGFWSKDAVLAASFESRAPWLLFPLALTGSLFTAIYVARALRLLWQAETAGGVAAESLSQDMWSSGPAAHQGRRGEGPMEPSNEPEGHEAQGRRTRSDIWMGVGLGGLAVAAAFLGTLVGPLEELLGVLPEVTLTAVLGVVVALTGLATGWLGSAERLLGRLRPWAESGFRVAGGLSAFTVQPALRLASSASRADELILGLASATGRCALVLARVADALDHAVHASVAASATGVLAVARRVSSTDQALHRLVEASATGTLAVARLVRSGDEDGIEFLIASMVRRTRALGRAARGLQSGLVHKELALAVGGTAALLALLSFVGFVQG